MNFSSSNNIILLLYTPGEEFFTEGRPAENFYVLLEGRVRITKKMSTSIETIIGNIGSGTSGWQQEFDLSKRRIVDITAGRGLV